MQVPTLSRDFGFFRPGRGDETQWDSVRVNIQKLSKLVGIIFCLPDTKIAKDEIFPFLEYLNVRSGDLVDFFLPGYGTDWPAEYQADPKTVATVKGAKLMFSAEAFNKLRADLAAKTTWFYSGETDLILLTAKYSALGSSPISFAPSNAVNLEKMLKDQAITSVRSYLEQISALADKYEGNDPVSYLSDQFGVKIGGEFLENALLSLVPAPIKDAWKAAKHHAVQSIAK